jgi:cytosine permease
MNSDSSHLEQEFEHGPVPLTHRHSTGAVAAIWFGFPMVLTNALFGGVLTWHLGFWQSLIAVFAGNLILLMYVGALSYFAGETGMSFALQAKRTFGNKGYVFVAGFLSTVVIGWYAFQTGLTGTVIHDNFGLNELAVTSCAMILYTLVTFFGVRALSLIGIIAAPAYLIMGAIALWFVSSDHSLLKIFEWKGQSSGVGSMSMGMAITIVIAGFADSGTMTADFTRWAKSGRSAVLATFSAFPVANVLSMLFGMVIVAAGAAVDPATNGGNFLPLLLGHSTLLSAAAFIFVFINLGSVCTHCLYNGAVGFSHLFGSKMRTCTIILGAVGGALAMLGVWQYFLEWLSLLGIVAPPIGAVMIVDMILMSNQTVERNDVSFRRSAFVSWAIGSSFAVAAHFWFPELGEALIGMLMAALAYLVIAKMQSSKEAAGLNSMDLKPSATSIR